MGAPMARNLASAGFAVRVWNRTREKAEAVEGVEVADSPEGAASGAGAVITMLADASAVEEAMTGGEGALPALEGAPWIQMSTIGLAGTERMKATAADLEAAADLELPFARAVTLQLRRAEACGLGEQDMAAVARMVGPDRGATRAET